MTDRQCPDGTSTTTRPESETARGPALTGPVYLPAGTPRGHAWSTSGRTVRVLAPTRRRVLARILDAVVWLTVVGAAVEAGALLGGLLPGGSAASALPAAVGAGLAAAVAWRWSVRPWMLSRLGYTPGRRIAGLRVVSLDDGAQPPSPGMARARSSAPLPGRLTSQARALLPRWAQPFPALGDAVVHAADARTGRCLHDLRAGTAVVLDRPPHPPGTPGFSEPLWRDTEHRVRVRLGVSVAAAAVAVPGAIAWTATDEAADRGGGFDVSRFFGGARVLEAAAAGGGHIDLDRTYAQTSASGGGCRAEAQGEAGLRVLRSLQCSGSVAAEFVTRGGSVQVGSHVLRFATAARAQQAADELVPGDVRFPVPRTAPQTRPGQGGLVEAHGRYVIVTVIADRPQSAATPDAVDQAREEEQTLTGLHDRVVEAVEDAG